MRKAAAEIERLTGEASPSIEEIRTAMTILNLAEPMKEPKT
jgi:hypothetical protein